MLRKLFPKSLPRNSTFRFSSTSPFPALYSFLRPTLFAPPPPNPNPNPNPQPQTLNPSSLLSDDPDEAWKAFKTFASASSFPSQSHVSTLLSNLSLKRAFSAAILLLNKHPQSLSVPTLESLFSNLESANATSPFFVLAKTVLKNRFFIPFSAWGAAAARLGRKDSIFFGPFMEVFQMNCRVAREEKVDLMVPDLEGFKVALEVCCLGLGSVEGMERVLEWMSGFGVELDEECVGFMAYVFAWKGMEKRVVEVEELVGGLGFEDKFVVWENLVGGYVRAGDVGSVSRIVLQMLRDQSGKDGSFRCFGEKTYVDVVRCFGECGKVKELADLIVESQMVEGGCGLESVELSVGFGIVNACVFLGWLDKAHSVLDEMNVRGAVVGLGVYKSILKAYCKEQRTAEAVQLVLQVNAAGLQLDAESYGALIEASMSVQDFQSAFSLYRGMREARLPDLKMSYLTIMTGLMENHRPELMGGFLDSVVEDPQIDVATHDWNSIIHSFCKAGRLEDARRTYRRMMFLQFEPNEQTYLSLINGYVSAEKYFSVLILWTDLKKRKGANFDNALVDAFLYALVKGGFFDAAMEVVAKGQELKIYIDKWRYKQAFMETHKKLKVAKIRRKSAKKTEALVAFKNWAGLNA